MCYNIRMVITYYGLLCFKIQSGEIVAATNPFEKGSGFTAPRFQAHVVVGNAASLTGEPFAISGPGEYEVRGIVVQGIASSTVNTVFILEWENMRLVYLGSLADKDVSEELLEYMGTPDILFLPLGSLTAQEAASLVNRVEPRVVIPMYTDEKDATTFLRERGSNIKPEDKFTFKKKDLPEEETKIVLLEPVTKP